MNSQCIFFKKKKQKQKHKQTTNIFPGSQHNTGLLGATKPVAVNATSIQIGIRKYYFPSEQNQGSFKKWLSLGLEEEMFKMRLEHFVIT